LAGGSGAEEKGANGCQAGGGPKSRKAADPGFFLKKKHAGTPIQGDLKTGNKNTPIFQMFSAVVTFVRNEMRSPPMRKRGLKGDKGKQKKKVCQTSWSTSMS